MKLVKKTLGVLYILITWNCMLIYFRYDVSCLFFKIVSAYHSSETPHGKSDLIVENLLLIGSVLGATLRLGMGSFWVAWAVFGILIVFVAMLAICQLLIMRFKSESYCSELIILSGIDGSDHEFLTNVFYFGWVSRDWCMFTNPQIHSCNSFQCLGIVRITNLVIGSSIIQDAMSATNL